ncbi:MAG: 3-dehydroquinate synthase [Candidatus Dormibacteraeota bacterium]|nr:3-dehydroquinate synthase [Candidatus Dormibacteraeota bacterium]
MRLAERAYPVLIGSGALEEVPRRLREEAVSSAVVVADGNVGGEWGEAVVAGLTGVGIRSQLHVVQAGEPAKSLAELRRVLDFLERFELDRWGVVVALGGGTVGDLAGFAAAVWLRGVRYVQVPTTLLAMVDASVGGKTGINSERRKNSIGAVWQPLAVFSDLSTLRTLPEAEYLGAFSEIVKYAVSLDRDLAETLRGQTPALRERNLTVLEPVVTRCIELKAQVVTADEREAGPREVLNYGHTVGHALEIASNFVIPHGRAVALGLRAAARLGAECCGCPESVVALQDDLLAAFGLPGDLPLVRETEVLAALPRDKKAREGRLRWVLPRELGKVQVGVSVPGAAVERVVHEVLS